MRLTCAIIDDEPLAVSLLESYVLKTPFLDLQGTYNSALDALSDLRDRPVDLLFLDIQMPELSGLEFSRILNADTRVIFTTAFDQYAVDSYRVNALDYLLKPISYPDFLASANKALRWYELLRKPVSSEEKEESAPIAEKGGMESIFVKSEYKLHRASLAILTDQDDTVLLLLKYLQCVSVVSRGDNHLEEDLMDLLGHFLVNRSIRDQDATESGNWVTGQSLFPSLNHITAGSDTASVIMF